MTLHEDQTLPVVADSCTTANKDKITSYAFVNYGMHYPI